MSQIKSIFGKFKFWSEGFPPPFLAFPTKQKKLTVSKKREKEMSSPSTKSSGGSKIKLRNVENPLHAAVAAEDLETILQLIKKGSTYWFNLYR